MEVRQCRSKQVTRHNYVITVLKSVPSDLVARVSAIHASAVLQAAQRAAPNAAPPEHRGTEVAHEHKASRDMTGAQR